MAQIAIQKQVDAVRKATEKATQSKEAALKFLIEAGIITEDKPKKTVKEKK